MTSARGFLPGLDTGPAAGVKKRPAGDRELLRDPRLWITVGLVALLAVAWQVTALLIDHPLSGNATTLLPLGIFLIPVLYASVTFGLSGGLVLAVASGLATVPWALASLSQHDTLAPLFDMIQVVVLVLVAYFVGRGVRAERRAREVAERSRQDHLLAEIRYRDLFDTNSQPILLADLTGVVHEANLAAQELFGAGTGLLSGESLPDLIGRDVFDTLRAGSPMSRMVDGPPRNDSAPRSVFRPAGRLVEIDGQRMLQVVLQDVTEDARRRQLAQAYAVDVLRGQEDERRRIAQELHDGPIQTLVHLCRLIDVAGDASGPVVPPIAGPPAVGPAPDEMAKLRSATQSVMDEVRQIARGLRPPLLDDLGLLVALERLCDDVEVRAGVAVSFQVHGDVPELSSPAELTVYRIAQEALSNIDRHAGASTVDIWLWAADGWLQLRVTDDGEGFDPAPGGPGTGGRTLGLAGMSERAELIGGALRVQSRRGEGTTVALAVPLGAVALATTGDGERPAPAPGATAGVRR